MEISAARNTANRLPLYFYYRLADQLIDQAKEYREEKNLADLYATLNKYCRLLSKIPQHQSYPIHSTKEKLHHIKLCEEFVKELESLKPQFGINSLPQKNHARSGHIETKVKYCGVAETKSQSFTSINKDDCVLASMIKVDFSTSNSGFEFPNSSTSTAWDVNTHCVTQSSPSPSISCTQSVPQAALVSHVPGSGSDSRPDNAQSSYQDIHVSARLMEDFLELAKDNTNNDLETCGVLGAFLKKGIFYVTTLIIPKQESSSSSCQAMNEEEIFAILNEHSLFPIGWIHTHPSQTCFMSSVDLHTQYSYQIMLPDAVAIVMAPTDSTRHYGIFRLSEPGGITVIKECQDRGFHTHREPSDGIPIYENCSNVYFNLNLRFEIFDLR